MDWNVAMLSMATPDQDQRANLNRALGLGMKVLEKRMPLPSTDSIISCFGLTVLAVRQSVAFTTLIDASLQDQSVTILRSLYETLINLTEVLYVNKYKDGADSLTPAQVDAERVKRARLFVESQRATNKRAMNALKQKSAELKAAVKKNKAQSWYAPAAVSMDAMVTQWSDRVDKEFKGYTNFEGANKPTAYWNNKGPSEVAVDSDVDLPHLYQWCCNFSHSSFYAVRTNLGNSSDGKSFQHGPCGDQYEARLVWFATWCLINCLDICFGALEAFSDTDRAEVQALVADFKQAKPVSKSKVPDM